MTDTANSSKWKQLFLQLFVSMEEIANSCTDCEALADCGGCLQIRAARDAVEKAKECIIADGLNNYCPICLSREIKEDPNIKDPEPMI